MARVIINADDFGLDVGTNLAICNAFKNSTISSTTLMANMPGFEHALEQIQMGKIDKKCIGIHLNLTQGTPLTEGIKNEVRFCSNGQFHGQIRNKPVFRLTKGEISSVSNEIQSQINRLRDAGIQIYHADGHHHIHTEWGIFSAIKSVLIQNDIKRIRISRNSFSKSNRNLFNPKNLYKRIFNYQVRKNGFHCTTKMGEFPDFFMMKSNQDETIEVMVHLVKKDENYLLDGIESPEYNIEVKDFIQGNQLISYSDL
jgi:predicted glycoside hydrolase/deacetylase ChbG (UPF0249 family)